jgi:hypothetical protein
MMTALLTQFFASLFLMRRRKRERITELAAQVKTNSMNIRTYLISFKEFDIDFQNQQKHASKAVVAKIDKAFEIHKEAALYAQKTTQHFGKEYAHAQTAFTEAAYLLTALHNRRFSKEDRFRKALEKIQAVAVSEDKNFAKAKQEINDKLLPELEVVHKLCHLIIYEQNRSIWEKFKDKLPDIRRKS